MVALANIVWVLLFLVPSCLAVTRHRAGEAGSLRSESPSWRQPRLDADIQKLLANLTLNEKAGQFLQSNPRLLYELDISVIFSGHSKLHERADSGAGCGQAGQFRRSLFPGLSAQLACLWPDSWNCRPKHTTSNEQAKIESLLIIQFVSGGKSSRLHNKCFSRVAPRSQ